MYYISPFSLEDIPTFHMGTNLSSQELSHPIISTLHGKEYNLRNSSELPFNQSNLFLNKTSNQHMENFGKVIDWMNSYLLPVLILVGLLGNSLSVCVFVLTHLRRLSSSVYLAGLAVADASFLICLLPEWCYSMGVHFFNKNGKCSPISLLLTPYFNESRG